MLQNYNKYKILKLFMDFPLKTFRLRELSRLSKISPPSVMNYLKELEDEQLIKIEKKEKIPFYIANFDNDTFREYKKISILFELKNSGLIDFLWDELAPEAIILYGSYSKGESVENSDIDLFILGKEKKINLEKYRKYLGKEIHLFFQNNPREISPELKNNLVNGIILKGYLKLF